VPASALFVNWLIGQLAWSEVDNIIGASGVALFEKPRVV